MELTYDYDRVVKISDSWAIDEIAYNKVRRDLRVSFPTTNSVWLFQDVPSEVFVELLLSDSIGETFNHLVRDNYPATRLLPLVLGENV